MVWIKKLEALLDSLFDIEMMKATTLFVLYSQMGTSCIIDVKMRRDKNPAEQNCKLGLSILKKLIDRGVTYQ